MSNDPADMSRTRRGSLSSATFSTLFPRSNSVSSGTPVFPGPITSAALNEQNRRRLSLSTTAAMGVTASTPASPSGGPGAAAAQQTFGMRRASISTSSSVSPTVDNESAIDEEDGSTQRISPRNTPFARRTSFGVQAMLSLRGQAPGHDQGYSWPEQFRSRAESVAAGSRSSFSFASGNSGGVFTMPNFGGAAGRDRSHSVSDVSPPVVAAPPRQRRPPRPKPDQFQERILKGDFYMD